MHELSVCLALLQQLEQIARDQNAALVEKIYLQIGPLSGIEPNLLQNAWPLAATGSIAEDAEFRISSTDIEVCCSKCGETSTAKANRLLCAACGDFRTKVISGDEMILERLELKLAKPEPKRSQSPFGQKGSDPFLV